MVWEVSVNLDQVLPPVKAKAMLYLSISELSLIRAARQYFLHVRGQLQSTLEIYTANIFNL
jgi:hypothetical protein